MKKYLLSLLMAIAVCCFSQIGVNAQAPNPTTLVSGSCGYSGSEGGSLTTSVTSVCVTDELTPDPGFTGNSVGLPDVEFIITNPQSIITDPASGVSGPEIVGSDEDGIFDPTLFGFSPGDQLCVTPISYNLGNVQSALEEILTGSIFLLGSCCGIIEGVVNQDVCGALNSAGINSGSDVNSLSDVLPLITAFGGVPTIEVLTDVLENSINTNAGLPCTGDLPICFATSTNSACYTYGVCGCTNPSANNFNPNADIDDGSCIVDVPGCTDITACNYNPAATVDDGNCVAPDCEGNCNGMMSGPAQPGTACDDLDPTTVGDVYDANCGCAGVAVFGCTDATACNFDPAATVDNSSCVYPDCEGACSGMMSGPAQAGTACDDGDPTTVGDVYDANCGCSGVTVPGCTDVEACNYDPAATVDDGTCIAPDCEGECDGMMSGPAQPGTPCDDGDPTTVGDVYDANCGCGGAAVFGCTDVTACNYDPAATVDDESCIAPDCEGECDGMMSGPAQAGTACDDGDPTTVGDVYDDNCGCSGVTVPGCTDVEACNYDPAATVDDESCVFPDCEGNCNGMMSGPAQPGTACDDGDPNTVGEVYDNNCACVGDVALGCTDVTACNYDPTATVNDGTCIAPDCEGECDGMMSGPAQPGTACDDGDPTTVEDVYDANCGCSGVTVPGCTDVEACNYNPAATVDDGTCVAPDCEGNCNGMMSGPAQPGTACDDGDPNTVGDVYDANCGCGGATVPGCTDVEACNYNPAATVDDGTCMAPDCEGECDGMMSGPAQPGTACDDGNPATTDDMYDANCNCVGSLLGCTDVVACNYNPDAMTDDGSCIAPDCEGECDGMMSGPAQPGTACDDGDPNTVNDQYDANCGCSGTFIPGCTDANAINFDPLATTDDGSCIFANCDYTSACPGFESEIITAETLFSYYNFYEIELTGGTGPYLVSYDADGFFTYSVNTSTNIITIYTGLGTSFVISITDANGCDTQIDSSCSSDSGDTTAAPLSILSANITPDIGGAGTGAVNITVSGGVLPYTYSWSNGGATQDIFGLPSGWYFIEIVDAAGTTTFGWYWVPSGRRGRGKLENLNTVNVYPNPFEGVATVEFTTTNDEQVNCEVFNASGIKVADLYNGTSQANTKNTVNFNAQGLAAGIYFVRLSTASGATTHQKLLLAK